MLTSLLRSAHLVVTLRCSSAPAERTGFGSLEAWPICASSSVCKLWMKTCLPGGKNLRAHCYVPSVECQGSPRWSARLADPLSCRLRAPCPASLHVHVASLHVHVAVTHTSARCWFVLFPALAVAPGTASSRAGQQENREQPLSCPVLSGRGRGRVPLDPYPPF